MVLQDKTLHWTQCLALVRHNLHMATRTGNFAFFKAIQAQEYCRACDHVANLNTLVASATGADADSILSSLDKQNAVIAFVFEDAFKRAYEIAKRHASGEISDRSLNLRDQIQQQLSIAEATIDRMIESTTLFIQQQPAFCREAAVKVFVIGTTFSTDAVEFCIRQTHSLPSRLDFSFSSASTTAVELELDRMLSAVQCTVAQTIGTMKGIFNLMSTSDASEKEATPVRAPVPTQPTSSMSNVLRRMSEVFSTSSSSSNGGVASVASNGSSRKSSLASSGSTRNPSVADVVNTPVRSSFEVIQHSGNTKAMLSIPATPGTSSAKDVGQDDPFAAAFQDNVAACQFNGMSVRQQQQRRKRRESVYVAPGELPVFRRESEVIFEPTVVYSGTEFLMRTNVGVA